MFEPPPVDFSCPLEFVPRKLKRLPSLFKVYLTDKTWRLRLTLSGMNDKSYIWSESSFQDYGYNEDDYRSPSEDSGLGMGVSDRKPRWEDT